MVATDVLAEAVGLVQGDLFCDMDNAWWDVAGCQEDVAWLLPRAMAAVGGMVAADGWAGTFCADIVGICH